MKKYSLQTKVLFAFILFSLVIVATTALTNNQTPEDKGTFKKSITEEIEFKVPNNWNIASQSEENIVINSDDLEYSETGFYAKGAAIYIYRENKGRLFNLEDVRDNVRKNMKWKDEKEKENLNFEEINVNNYSGVKLFYCYEGCSDVYYIPANDNLWTISFICRDEDCSQKESDFEILLRSIRFN